MKFEELISEYLPDKESTDFLADYFSLFADRTRMRIVSLLSIGEMCVNDISYLLQTSQSTISHQLQKLKKNGVVDSKKIGKRTIYYLSNPKIEEMCLAAVIATEN